MTYFALNQFSLIIVTLWNSFCLGKTKGNETLVKTASRMAVPFSPPYKPKAFSFAQPTQKTIINQKKNPSRTSTLHELSPPKYQCTLI